MHSAHVSNHKDSVCFPATSWTPTLDIRIRAKGGGGGSSGSASEKAFRQDVGAPTKCTVSVPRAPPRCRRAFQGNQKLFQSFGLQYYPSIQCSYHTVMTIFDSCQSSQTWPSKYARFCAEKARKYILIPLVSSKVLTQGLTWITTVRNERFRGYTEYC